MTEIELACREHAQQVCDRPFKENYVCVMHNEAIVWNHCMNMRGLAESALWMMQ